MKLRADPGNPKIHRVILLVYLTIIGSFPENKLHSMEMGVVFLSLHNNPLRMLGRKLERMSNNGIPDYDGPGLPPWTLVV